MENENLKQLMELILINLRFIKHDAKKYLQIISGYLQLIELGIPPPESLFLDAKTACENLNNILSLMKGYDEKESFISAKNVWEKSTAFFTTSIKERKIKIKHKLEGLKLSANESLLIQFFSNLVRNSLDHAGEKLSEIKIYYEIAEKTVVLIYKDNGSGINKENKTEIFKEGYGSGTGEGLYLIERLCKLYGWKVTEKGIEGKGAEFAISVPSSKCKIERL